MYAFQTLTGEGTHLFFRKSIRPWFHEKKPLRRFFSFHAYRIWSWYYILNMPKLSLIFFLIASSVMAVIHIIALELSLYWQIVWLDIPMHALGGATVALGIFAIHDLWEQFPSRLLYPIPVLLFVLMAALLWEVYEIGIGIPIEDNFEADTILDIVMDMLGGVIGYIVGYSVSSLEFEDDHNSEML